MAQRNKESCYYVVVFDDKMVGCGGIAPLTGGSKFTCELRKMFFLPATRGKGLGQRLLLMLLAEANKRGYKKCYLETLDRMWQANELYKANGFVQLDKPLGKTGHCSCDRWYLRSLPTARSSVAVVSTSRHFPSWRQVGELNDCLLKYHSLHTLSKQAAS